MTSEYQLLKDDCIIGEQSDTWNNGYNIFEFGSYTAKDPGKRVTYCKMLTKGYTKTQSHLYLLSKAVVLISFTQLFTI